MQLPFIHRSFWSYSKVQRLWGACIRNSRRQLRTKRMASLRYLDVGCGTKTHEKFINLDYLWVPQVDLCWDITRGLPFRDSLMQGIFTEHCLEHFPLPTGVGILRELRRVLAPGGTLHIVVPDGELYMKTYVEQLSGNRESRFPFQEREEFEGIASPILSVNRIYYQDRESAFGHCAMFDAALLIPLLKRAGFASAARAAFREGRDPELLLDTPARACESVYVEAW